MVTLSRSIVVLVAALSAATPASPGLAQSRADHPGHAQTDRASEERSKAITECNREAAGAYKWFDGSRDGMYRSCMAKHHQPE